MLCRDFTVAKLKKSQVYTMYSFVTCDAKPLYRYNSDAGGGEGDFKRPLSTPTAICFDAQGGN